MANEAEPSETKRYLERQVDGRMIKVIGTYIGAEFSSVIDIACGSGLYGEALAKVAQTTDGVDFDPDLVAVARKSGAYDNVFELAVEDLASLQKQYDVVFCSEFLEHVSNDMFATTISAIESVANNRVVLTVPNPRSPHFKQDPTHILNYRVRSLKRLLSRSSEFSYSLKPLGFADEWRERTLVKLLQPLASQVAVFSPTVLFVGDRRQS